MEWLAGVAGECRRNAVVGNGIFSRVCTTEVNSSHESQYALDIWLALKGQSLFMTGQGDNFNISFNSPLCNCFNTILATKFS